MQTVPTLQVWEFFTTVVADKEMEHSTWYGLAFIDKRIFAEHNCPAEFTDAERQQFILLYDGYVHAHFTTLIGQ